MIVHSDTSPAARAVQDEILRSKTPGERLEIARGLTIGVQLLAFAALRQDHPELSDDAIWLILAERRLGSDLVRKVYGESSLEP